MKFKIFSVALHAFFAGLNATFIFVNIANGKSWWISAIGTAFCAFCAYDSCCRVYDEVKK